MKSLLIIFFISLFLPLLAPGANSDEQKIRELEQRIQALEKQLSVATSKESSAELEEIRRQLEILAAELEKLRSGEEEIALAEPKRRALGLGASAATVYSKKRGVSLAGYGEMLYQNFAEETEAGDPSGGTDQIDFLRAILYVGYRFNENVLFNSEIEFEHATTGEGAEEKGEVSIEFAHIDYRINDAATIRAGMVLLPMGFINEIHEPTSFLGARRPVTETVIIPSTWRENGAGVVGRTGMIDYRTYIMSGFNAAGFSSSGLRDGRQGGSEAKFEDPSWVGRIDVTPTPGLFLGGSVFAGKSGVFEEDLETDLTVTTFISEGHVEYKSRGLELRALYAQASLDDVEQLNQVLGLEGDDSVGETLRGGYLQAGYNVWAGSGKGKALTPYFRYETVNTQADVPAGFQQNPAREQTIWTLGLEYRPILNIVVKADYQWIGNDAETGVNQFNVLLGYSF